MTIPIIVPLYFSNHIIPQFMRSLSLEEKQDYHTYFILNDEDKNNYEDLRLKLSQYNFNKFTLISPNTNLFYSKSINTGYRYAFGKEADNSFSKYFYVTNPDCFPLEENWLSRLIEIFNIIERGEDKKIASLGTLQFSNYEKTRVWHYGCMWKDESKGEQKCHPLDWRHNTFYQGKDFIKCDGNTGTGILINNDCYKDIKFDDKNHPHYCSDARWAEETSQAGWSHYCSNVQMFHQPGQSTRKEK